MHLPVIFTLLTRISCSNYNVVNQALYLVGKSSFRYVDHVSRSFIYCSVVLFIA